jgi:hypothetical protein
MHDDGQCLHGSILAMIDVWGVNMARMAQSNCVGTDVTDRISKMKKGMHDGVCWKHKMLVSGRDTGQRCRARHNQMTIATHSTLFIGGMEWR